MATSLTVYATSSRVQRVIAGGSPLEVAGDVAGNRFLNTSPVVLVVRNSGGSDYTLTLIPQQTVDALSAASRVLTITAGDTAALGPFPGAAYNDVDGYCYVTPSNAALKLTALSVVTT